jgi:hypothetical protein
LLDQFKGRTLEEIDQMDWARYNRALVARNIVDAEQTARLHNSGRLKSKDIDKATWQRIKKNEVLYAKWLAATESGED